MLSDDEARTILRGELGRRMAGVPLEERWPLEPIRIDRQSDHFWQLTSNAQSTGNSLRVLVDPQSGKVLSVQPSPVGPGGSIVVELIPSPGPTLLTTVLIRWPMELLCFILDQIDRLRKSRSQGNQDEA